MSPVYNLDITQSDSDGYNMAIRLLSKVEYLALNRSNVEHLLQTANIQDTAVSEIILSVDEALANIMEHATPKGLSGAFIIDLNLKIEPEQTTIIILDQGSEFNPFEYEKPDIKAHVAAGRKGGLGIYIIKKVMDSYSYEYAEGKNKITLIKKHNCK